MAKLILFVLLAVAGEAAAFSVPLLLVAEVSLYLPLSLGLNKI